MKILIAMPTYDRRVDMEVLRTIVQLERKREHDFNYVLPVSSHLSRNRNLACHEAMENGHEAVLFWDSDIGIEDVGFISKLLDTAYRYDSRVVGGAYRIKNQNMQRTEYVATEQGSGDSMKLLTQVPGPMIVDAVGTGIMLVFREVLEKVQDPWFTIVDKPNLKVIPEDFDFCRKAREAGFKIAVDPRFATIHYGQFGWKHL